MRIRDHETFSSRWNEKAEKLSNSFLLSCSNSNMESTCSYLGRRNWMSFYVHLLLLLFLCYFCIILNLFFFFNLFLLFTSCIMLLCIRLEKLQKEIKCSAQIVNILSGIYAWKINFTYTQPFFFFPHSITLLTSKFMHLFVK